MDKRDISDEFRNRLETLILRSGLNRSHSPPNWVLTALLCHSC